MSETDDGFQGWQVVDGDGDFGLGGDQTVTITHRLKVKSGWLYRTSEYITYSGKPAPKSQLRAAQFTSTMCFVPDPDHAS